MKGIRLYHYTIPGGKIDIWDNITNTVKREIEEEVWIRIRDIKYIWCIKSIARIWWIKYELFEIITDQKSIIWESDKFEHISWAEKMQNFENKNPKPYKKGTFYKFDD